MTDHTISPAGGGERVAPRGADRVAIAAALGGAALLLLGAAVLWSREGLGVFVEVILAGLAACF